MDSIIISVFFLGSDSWNSVLPSFVGFGMLKNLSETQHRIWEDIDFCNLKIDDCFIFNQWQTCPRILFPLNFVQVIDFVLVIHQLCGDIEHLWDLHDSWQHFELWRNSFPWMSPHSSSQPWRFFILLNAFHLTLQRSTFFAVCFALGFWFCSQVQLRHFPWRNFQNESVLVDISSLKWWSSMHMVDTL